MRNIANTIIDGNLVQDPEVKKTKSDKTVASFFVAVNHEWGPKEGNAHVSYIPVETWERLAENCGQYLKKGRKVTVEGELRQDRWVDENGKMRSRIKIVARGVRFDYVPRPMEEKPAADRPAEETTEDKKQNAA